jgi:beta-glucosidase-like glycosyl hydrolase
MIILLLFETCPSNPSESVFFLPLQADAGKLDEAKAQELFSKHFIGSIFDNPYGAQKKGLLDAKGKEETEREIDVYIHGYVSIRYVDSVFVASSIASSGSHVPTLTVLSSPSPFPPKAWRNLISSIQSLGKKAGLKVPLVYGLDSIHGASYVHKATLFPQQINLAAALNVSLASIMGTVTAQDSAAGRQGLNSKSLKQGRLSIQILKASGTLRL